MVPIHYDSRELPIKMVLETCVPIIFSPYQIPPGTRFHIHEYLDKASVIQRIMAVAVPDSTCLSVGSDLGACLTLASESTDCVISCDPSVYFGGHWRKPNCFFIPATERNASSFWHFGYIIFNHLRVQGGRLALDEYLRLAAAGNILAAPAVPTDADLGFRRKHNPYFKPDWVRSRIADIHLIHRNLADQNSRDSFLRYMYADPLTAFDYFLTGVLRKTQYFDYLHFTGGEVVINCGVDNGWELPFFLAATENAVRVHNLDPSADAALAPYARAFVDQAPDCFSFHKLAVWGRDTQVSFANNRVSEIGGSADAKGKIMTGLTIDSFCRTQALPRVDVIKMDVEGAEPEAIKGMMAAVTQYRPQLAIAIYHDEEQAQALDIPVAIINSVENYNFYLDTYNFDLGETIFYATPREKDRRKSDCFVVQ